MPPQELATLFADLATALSTPHEEPVTARLVVRLALEVVPAADEAALTVPSRRHRLRVLASSSDTGRTLEERQHAAGEGPALDAVSGTDLVRSDDLAAEPRWATWTPEAVSHGAACALSLPLLSGTRRAGALSLYAERVDAFGGPETVEMASLYARHAANAMVVARHVTGLETALESRHMIGMAQGILMTRFGIDEDQSFAVLRRVSSNQNVKLREVAQHVVDTGELPDAPAGGTMDGAVAEELG